MKGLGNEKVFEMTIVEFLDFKFNPASIYRSPDGDFYKCLHKLESVICKVQSKGKHLIYAVTGTLISHKTEHNSREYKIDI